MGAFFCLTVYIMGHTRVINLVMYLV